MTTEMQTNERQKILRQEFAQLDLNHDSVLTRDELFRALDDLVSLFFEFLNFG